MSHPAPETQAAAPEQTPTTGRSWLIIVLVVVFMMVNWADKSALGIAAVPIMDELHIGPAKFGLLGSAYYFLYAVSTIVFGVVATRVRANRLILVLVFVWSLCQLPVAMFASFGVLFASRLFLGVAEAPATPMSNFLAHSWFRDDRRAVPSTLVMIGSPLGVLLAGPGLTSVMTAFGWRSLFVSLAILGVCWGIVWLFLGGEGPHSGREPKGARTGAPRASLGTIYAQYLRPLINRSWLLSTLAGFAGYWGVALLSTWLPAYITKGLGYDEKTTGHLLVVWPIVSIVSMIGLSMLSTRLTRRGVSTRWTRGLLLGATLTVGAVLLIAGTLTETPALAFTLVSVGLALNIPTHPIMFMLVGEVAPAPLRAFSISLSAALLVLAGVIAPALTGALVEQVDKANGYPVAFGLCAGLMLVAGLLAAAFIDPRRYRRRVEAA